MALRYWSVLVGLMTLFSPVCVFAQTSLTYENWAQSFFTRNCIGCHHSNLSGDFRFGAPDLINFDTLDQIRDYQFDIRDAATGDDPIMPPTGVLWWWDRVSLLEWLDAGLPGEGDSFSPVDFEPTQESLSYSEEVFVFGSSIEGVTQNREILFHPLENGDWVEGATTERMSISLQSDGTVVLNSITWVNHEQGTTRLIEHFPSIPILLDGTQEEDLIWESLVNSRERYWEGWTGHPPRTDIYHSNQWRVENEGIERIDNAIILPQDALKITQSNIQQDIQTSWWYIRNRGLARIEENKPSSDARYEREITRRMNVIQAGYPMYQTPLHQDDLNPWLPFKGFTYDEGIAPSEHYVYEFNQQRMGILPGGYGAPDPTVTPTLPVDPTFTPVVIMPTFTPFPPGLPPTRTITNTSPPIPTPTETDVVLPPMPTVTSTQDPNDPSHFDHNGDHSINTMDLLMFLRNWHREIE